MPDNVVLIRPQIGAVECDVVVIVRDEEMIVRCRNWQDAVAWARVECRTYGLPHDFPDERPPLDKALRSEGRADATKPPKPMVS